MAHMQIAVTGVTDRHRALFSMAALHSAKNSGSANSEPAGRYLAFHRNDLGTSRITADDRDLG